MYGKSVRVFGIKGVEQTELVVLRDHDAQHPARSQPPTRDHRLVCLVWGRAGSGPKSGLSTLGGWGYFPFY
eukprot:gene10435-biopygen1361